MGAEHRIENLAEEGDRSVGMVLHGPVWDTILAGDLADLKIRHDILNLVGIVKWSSLAWVR
jgi:hypothetical protein